MNTTVRYLHPGAAVPGTAVDLAFHLACLADIRGRFPGYGITTRPTMQGPIYEAVARHPGMDPASAASGTLTGLQDMLEQDTPAMPLNTSIPSSARIHNFLLGGKNHFPADRETAEAALAIRPELHDMAVTGKKFLTLAVRYVSGQGVRQFIDLGAGLPTIPPLDADGALEWEPAHVTAPSAAVAYVDHDPMVVAHNQALLTHGIPGTDSCLGDLRDPDAIWMNGAVRRMMDLRQPVCLIFGCVLHYLTADEAERVMAEYAAQLAPGSFVIISGRHYPGETGHQVAQAENSGGGPAVHEHTPDEIRGLFADMEIVPPGVVNAARWRPGWAEPGLGGGVPLLYGGVACRR